MGFIWKIRYAFIMWNTIRPRAKALWGNAQAAYEDNMGINTPAQAVNNVVEGIEDVERRVWNEEVDRKKAQ